MANRWVDVPLHLPRKCPLTGRSAPEAGPYLEVDFRYFDADPVAASMGELTLNTLYLSSQYLREAMNLDGTPFLAMDPEKVATLIAEIADKSQQIVELERRVAELEAGAPVTVTQDALRLLLDSAEQAPASGPVPSAGSTDPDHHTTIRVPRKKAAR